MRGAAAPPPTDVEWGKETVTPTSTVWPDTFAAITTAESSILGHTPWPTAARNKPATVAPVPGAVATGPADAASERGTVTAT